MICRKCRSTKVKGRTNYPHGKKSTAVVVLTCKVCGSCDIGPSAQKYNNRRR